MRQSAGQSYVDIHLRRVTSIPFPVTMRLKLNDGTTQDVRLPVEIWSHSDRYTASVPVIRPVIGVRLWPDPNVPDWNPSNDVWGEAPPANPQSMSTGGGAVPPIPVVPGKRNQP